MIRVAISLVAALLGIASTMSQPAAQALGPDEAHDAPVRVRPNVTLSPAQKRTIYNAVLQQRLRTSPSTRSIRIGVAQPIVSASEKYLISAPASAAMARPSSRVEMTCAGAMSP